MNSISIGTSKSIPILLFASLLSFALVKTHEFDSARSERNSKTRLREPLDIEDVGAQQLRNYLELRDPATGEIPRGIHTRELAFARTLRQSNLAFKVTPTIHTTGWNFAGPITDDHRILLWCSLIDC